MTKKELEKCKCEIDDYIANENYQPLEYILELDPSLREYTIKRLFDIDLPLQDSKCLYFPTTVRSKEEKKFDRYFWIYYEMLSLLITGVLNKQELQSCYLFFEQHTKDALDRLTLIDIQTQKQISPLEYENENTYLVLKGLDLLCIMHHGCSYFRRSVSDYEKEVNLTNYQAKQKLLATLKRYHISHLFTFISTGAELDALGEKGSFDFFTIDLNGIHHLAMSPYLKQIVELDTLSFDPAPFPLKEDALQPSKIYQKKEN